LWLSAFAEPSPQASSAALGLRHVPDGVRSLLLCFHYDAFFAGKLHVVSATVYWALSWNGDIDLVRSLEAASSCPSASFGGVILSDC
ncbi:unnamed protein product, partial [Durusdinium trenchii]